MNKRRWVEYADHGKHHITPKSIAPAWQGWMSYMYDDPPSSKYYVNPAYRPNRTYHLKLDHPTQSFRNPGHIQNPHRTEYSKSFQDKDHVLWEPPASD